MNLFQRLFEEGGQEESLVLFLLLLKFDIDANESMNSHGFYHSGSLVRGWMQKKKDPSVRFFFFFLSFLCLGAHVIPGFGFKK